MPKLAAVLLLILAAGCAAHRNEITPLAAESSAANGAVLAAIAGAAGAPEPKTVELSELDTGLVCEPRIPTGSRIARNVCYSAEDYAAQQDAKRENAQRYLDDLRRDQEMRAIQERAIEERRRQATIGGFGGQ